MLTYTNVYNYCTAATKRDDGGGARPRRVPNTRTGTRPTSSSGFIGAELYERLRTEIKSRVETISKEGTSKVR